MKYLPCLLWPPMIVIKAVLVLLGLVIVPLALLTRRLTLDGTASVDNHWPDIFKLWGNDEEGCPEWWFTRCANSEEGKVAEWFPQFWWYAIRNPVNNMRFLFKDEGKFGTLTDWSVAEPMEAPQLRNLNRKAAFRYNWRKWQSGYRRVWLNSDAKYSEIWVGWKIGSKVPGLGFAMQFRYKRKIGT